MIYNTVFLTIALFAHCVVSFVIPTHSSLSKHSSSSIKPLILLKSINSRYGPNYCDDENNEQQQSILHNERRRFLSSSTATLILPTLVMSSCFYPSTVVWAKTGGMQTSQFSGASSPTKKANISPDEALQRIIKAREELIVAFTDYIIKRDLDGLRDYVASDQATNINNFESNILTILSSKKLDDEDKKAIGTIRRYGVGADVMIMYGGMVAEIDEMVEEPNFFEVQKFCKRAIDSLNEVIAICQNSGNF